MQAVVVYNLSYFCWSNCNDHVVKGVKGGDSKRGKVGKNNKQGHQSRFHVYPNLRLQQFKASTTLEPATGKKGEEITEGEESLSPSETGESSTGRRILESMKKFGTRTFDKMRLANYRGLTRSVRNKARNAFSRLARSNETRFYEQMPPSPADDEDDDLGFFDTDDISGPSTSARVVTPTSTSTNVTEAVLTPEVEGGQEGQNVVHEFKIKSTLRRSFRKVLAIKNLVA